MTRDALLVVGILGFVATAIAAQTLSEHRTLTATSKYRNAATDGTDLGAVADFATIERRARGGEGPIVEPPPPPPPDPLPVAQLFAGQPFELLLRTNAAGVEWWTVKRNGAYLTHVGRAAWKMGLARIPIAGLEAGTYTLSIEAYGSAGRLTVTTLEGVRVTEAPPLSSAIVVQVSPR